MKKLTLITAILMMSNMLTAQWIHLPNPYIGDNDSLRVIYFIDHDHGFVGGNTWGEGHLKYTVDAGYSWDDYIYWYFTYPISISFPDNNHGWLISDMYGNTPIYCTFDGGFNQDSWVEMDTLQNVLYKRSIFFTDSLNGWFCGGVIGDLINTGYAYSTSDGGISWIKSFMGAMFNTPLYDIFFINDSTGWTAGEWGKILHTTNKGETWVGQDLGSSITLRSIQFTDENIGWIAGETTESGNISGIIYKTINGGNDWESQLGETVPAIKDIAFTDSQNGWAVGDSGVILHTSNGGGTWEYQQGGTIANLKSVYFIDINYGWICGDSSIILHTNNGGTVGINKIFRKDNSMEIFPNPVTDVVTISFELEQNEKITLSVINTKGQEVKQMNLGEQEKGQIDLDCSNFSSGVYFINLQTKKGILTEKIIIE